MLAIEESSQGQAECIASGVQGIDAESREIAYQLGANCRVEHATHQHKQAVGYIVLSPVCANILGAGDMLFKKTIVVGSDFALGYPPSDGSPLNSAQSKENQHAIY